MSHELRTPLNAVLGFTQLLQIEARKDHQPDQLAKLDHIRDAGDHLLSLINDVLDLSGLESGEVRLSLQAVDLGALVRRSLPLLQSLAEQHGVVVVADRSDGLACADPTRLRQVLINLISNAIKYNRRGGRVVIETSDDGVVATLTVRDTGRGLSAEQIGTLFEPFNRFGVEQRRHRGHRHRPDDRQVAGRRHEGAHRRRQRARPRHDLQRDAAGGERRAGAERAGAGSRAGARSATHQRRARAARHDPLHRGQRGQRPARRRARARASAASTIVSEPTGSAGVERAVALRPDLILIDLQLPDFDGYEVLRRLRAEPRTRAIPCVALSANAMREDIERGLAAGFADYWTKPIDFAVFIAAIERMFPRARIRPKNAAVAEPVPGK